MANWMQKAAEGIKKKGTKGSLRKQLKVKKGKRIATKKLQSAASKLKQIRKKKGKLTASQRKTSRRVNLALRFRGK